MIILFEREGYRHECDFINEQKMPSGSSFLSERIIPKFGSPVKSKHKIYQKEIKKKRKEREAERRKGGVTNAWSKDRKKNNQIIYVMRL